jgi:hypothetical protein
MQTPERVIGGGVVPNLERDEHVKNISKTLYFRCE